LTVISKVEAWPHNHANELSPEDIRHIDLTLEEDGLAE
jgi:hypothetical protein